MPERTSYEAGRPSWVDLATTDVAGAQSFYGALFGWTAHEMDTGDMGGRYFMLHKDGKVVAGMAPVPSDDTPTVWSVYLAVDDVDSVTAKVTEAGGSVMMPPMDVMDTGRMAFIADPTGAMIGLWQAGTHIGSAIIAEPGTHTWVELLTDDVAAAQAFYTDVFGYDAETNQTPNGPYTVLMLGGEGVAGMMPRTPQMGDFPNYWGVYFGVEDADAAVATASANGGTVLMPGMDIPEVGRIAVIRDPQGGSFTVMQSA